MATRGCEAAPSDQCELANKMRFSVLSYNMLCNSLGSNCIPWVMSAGASFQAAVERATGVPFHDWKQREVAPDYSRHFHKNMATGDYTAMRRFWAARRCVSQADVPATMTGVKFHAEDQISYVDGKSGEQVVASTLRGVLRAKLPQEGLGLSLFEHLLEQEETVYCWESARGPRVFREIMGRRSMAPTDPAGQSALASEAPAIELQAAPDLVLLQEYDVFAVEADYRGAGQTETFVAAMAAEGYGHILFTDPLLGRTPPQGHGVFWRASEFELDGMPADGAQVLDCGHSLGSTWNVDLKEHWHRKAGDGVPELLNSADRRNVAIMRLRHRRSGLALWVLACHLMTTSRDSPKTNRFPGEVRAGELRTIREEVSKLVPAGEALLLVGDFNTDVRELLHFAAPLRGAEGHDDELLVDAGLGQDGGSGDFVLDWQAGGHPVRLQEAFSAVHRWGAGVGPHDSGGHCTSVNANRLEWIDYMWYSEAHLRPLGLSDMRTPQGTIPDTEHASDHLPLAALFEFRSSPA